MIKEFDGIGKNVLDEKDREKYGYPYLKILLNTRIINSNARKNNDVVEEALQECMKTCFDVYQEKLDRLENPIKMI